MGRNYFCEYCLKRVKNDYNVRKSHNEGLLHKIAKAEYLVQYRDPKDILEEENKKKPCSRYFSGKQCKFGLFCHFSHYSPEQIAELNYLARRKRESISLNNHNNSDRLLDYNTQNSEYFDELKLWLWKYPFENNNGDSPKSLQPYSVEEISKSICFSLWGNN